MLVWVKEIAQEIDSIALEIEGVEKNYLKKHHSYEFENQVLFYLKKDDNKITLGCHKGYLLDDKFDFEYGSKYIRHLYIKNKNDFNEEIIKNYINEAIICSIELNEKKKIKQEMRRA